MVDFTRSLGYEVGVQLNPTIDNSEGFAVDAVEEQTIAGALRLSRGRVDKSFVVNKANVFKLTGKPSRLSDESDTGHIELIECLNSGVKQALISRIGTVQYHKWILIDINTSTNKVEIKTADNLSGEDYIYAFKHWGCFDDGIEVKFALVAFAEDATKIDYVIVQFLDKDGNLLDEFKGAFESDNEDETPTIKSLIESFSSDYYECEQKSGVDINELQKSIQGNGLSLNNVEVNFASAKLDYFKLSASDSIDAMAEVKKLDDSDTNFVYISSFSNKSTALISQLSKLAFNRNVTLFVDVPPTLTPSQAIAWQKQLGLISHLLVYQWFPAKMQNPVGFGRGYVGSSAYRCALACARNAQTNALGFAPKQYAIAGKSYPIQRQKIKAQYKPNQFELSDLAKAGITPVTYQTFTGFGAYIFNDAITKLGKNSSYLNLVSSVDIVTSVERALARIAKEFLLFMPIQEALKLTIREGGKYLSNAFTSGWLVNSSVSGLPYELKAVENAQRPNDTIDIMVSMRPEGCTRQIKITPTVTR